MRSNIVVVRKSTLYFLLSFLVPLISCSHEGDTEKHVSQEKTSFRDGGEGYDIVPESNASCTDHCFNEGITHCISGNAYATCTRQTNGCLDWSSKVSCNKPSVCSSSTCVQAPTLDPKEVLIQAGSFTMGSPVGELGRGLYDYEILHKVTLTRSFYLWKYEVTQGEFKTLMGYNPSPFSSCGPNCPVESVSWSEAAAFCNALSKQKGLPECYDCAGKNNRTSCTIKAAYSGSKYYGCKGYRLPTEAEWEYAYRAGTRTAFYNGEITSSSGADPGLDKIGWYQKNSNITPHPVGRKSPNAWGLYDMAGNVSEWTFDWHQITLGASPVIDPINTKPPPSSTGSFWRVWRGGGWSAPSSSCRAAYRNGGPVSSSYRRTSLGLRIARSL